MWMIHSGRTSPTLFGQSWSHLGSIILGVHIVLEAQERAHYFPLFLFRGGISPWFPVFAGSHRCPAGVDWEQKFL